MSEHDELLPDFIAESLEGIEQARRDLESLSSGGDRSELLNGIFRAVHTIKGGSAMFGFDTTKGIAHKLESLLDTLRNAPQKLTPRDVTNITRVIDHLETLLQNHDRMPAQEQAPALDTEPVRASASASTPTPAPTPIEAAPASAAPELAGLSDQLSAVAAESPKGAPAAAGAQPAAQLAERPQGKPAVRDGVEMLRVPVERVQRNLDVISEVFLIRNQMTYLVEKHFAHSGSDHGFVQAWESLDNALRRSIGELENVAMSMRMMPLKGLFSRMEKTVRTYISDSGKEIHVETAGEDTELDKKVLDALGEPLIHLIRNAMDHGIEDPKARRAAGKPDTGTIWLGAKVAGNEVVLNVRDDGRGIVAERIRAAAAAKGIDVSKATDDRAAVELIFLPGFSTAAAVTETSGRGVGMDVVKSAVERLGGSITIDTRPGEGTTFVIRLPLSMSVMPAIVVRINGQLFAVGTGDIIETQRVPVREVRVNAGATYLKYRGEFIPCHNLEDFLQAGPPVEHAYQATVFVCIVRHRDGFVALRVGALENNTEVVVKPLPRLAPQIAYVTGISVLPTGQPVFVLSLGRLCREKIVAAGGNAHEAA